MARYVSRVVTRKGFAAVTAADHEDGDTRLVVDLEGDERVVVVLLEPSVQEAVVKALIKMGSNDLRRAALRAVADEVWDRE